MHCVFICLPMALTAQTEDGYKQYFHPNGKVASEGYIVDGRPEGKWSAYYDTGILKSQGDRKGFELDSTWLFFGPDGRLISTIDYKTDKKNGPARNYASDGSLVSEELFVEDLKQGETRYFHPDGKVHKVIPFKNGKEDGRSIEYAEDGRIVVLATYRAGVLQRREEINRRDQAGLRQGSWKEFLPNGKIKWEGTFVDDKRQGIFKEYDGVGNLKNMVKYDMDEVQIGAKETMMLQIKNTYHPSGKVSSLGSYSKDGQKEGLFRLYDEQGSVVSAVIYQGDRKMSEGGVNEAGALEGPWTEYYATGEKRAEGSYKAGKREGDWTYFHRSGEVEQRGKYQNGLAQGAWIWFYEGGARHREENYRKGKEDGASVEYDALSEVITQGEYIDGLRDGMWTYHVGDHREEGAYKDGLKDGPWVHTYENGKKSFSGSFVNGEPDGKQRWYWPNGNLMEEGRYSMGLRQGDFMTYDQYGNLVMTIKYKDGHEMRIDGEKVPPPYEPGGSLEQ